MFKSTFIAIAILAASATASLAGDTITYTRTNVKSLLGDSQTDSVVMSQRIGLLKDGFRVEVGPGVKISDTEDFLLTGEVGYTKFIGGKTGIDLTAEPTYNFDTDNFDIELEANLVVAL